MNTPHQYDKIFDPKELPMYLDISSNEDASNILYILYSDFIDTIFELTNFLNKVLEIDDIDPTNSSNINKLCHKVKSSALTVGAFKLSAELITLQNLSTTKNSDLDKSLRINKQIHQVVSTAQETKIAILKCLEGLLMEGNT